MNYAKLIDHTLLKQNSIQSQFDVLCLEAKTHDFATVCVNPSWVSYCKDKLKDSSVMVCTVIGFPLGATSSQSKAFETQQALSEGADEFDMVINIGALKDHRDAYVLEDIKAVVKAASGKTVKVIIETCLLNEEEKVRATELVVQSGAHFVKTSTGFSTSGATLEDVQLLSKVAAGRIKVKAAGGVRSSDDLKAFVEAGAQRIGTSSGVSLIQGLDAQSSY